MSHSCLLILLFGSHLVNGLNVDLVDHNPDQDFIDECQSNQESPSIKISEPWVHAGVKTTVALQCKICAQKPFSVWWTKDGESIPDSGRVREMSYHQTLHLLKIKNVREKDFGRYECNLYSNKTFKQVHESIEVSGVPYPAVFDLPNTWSETSFALSWKVNCSTTAPVISYRLEFRESGSYASSDADSDWVVVNIPAPRHDVTHVATATTSIPMHVDIDEDEIFNFQSMDHVQRYRKRKHSNIHSHIQEFKQSYTLRGLARGTSYETRVRSRNAFGLSAFSDVLNFRTFDLRQSTTTTSTSTTTAQHSNNIQIETVTLSHVTLKPDATQIRDDDQTGVVLERGASSEPLSTRRNQGYAAFSSASLDKFAWTLLPVLLVSTRIRVLIL